MSLKEVKADDEQSRLLIPEIYQLIPQIMKEVGAIEKTKFNQGQKFHFRGIEDMLLAFQPVLIKFGVFFVPEVLSASYERTTSSSGGGLNFARLSIAYTFYAPDGSSIRAVVQGEAMDSGDKASNKALSVALKYALIQVFCVPTEDIADSDRDSHELADKSARTPASALGSTTASHQQKNATASNSAPTKTPLATGDLNIEASGRELYESGLVGKDGEIYKIGKGKSHNVVGKRAGIVQCTCLKDRIKNDDPICPHIYAVRLFVANANVAS